MDIGAVGLSLLVVAAVYLLLGAAALLPADGKEFWASCVRVTAGMAVVGIAALLFSAAA
jgi:hypothetical protein